MENSPMSLIANYTVQKISDHRDIAIKMIATEAYEEKQMKKKLKKPSVTYGMILREVNSSSRKVLEFYQTLKGEERAENI